MQHPQIPRFWAAFEDEQRLFLVQDFIKGETYRRLLQARKHQGQAFSEAEVLHCLNHLLPVLSYLHDRDIIHRDISPENIILRASDSEALLFGQPETSSAVPPLPVLIDFGAVKEAASHWPIISAITRVGKVGYAPPEQLQTGNVSPHSDLYALGATSLVLLTGREPQVLLDSQTLTWQWQPYAKLSDVLATVLQKMLALQPNERYQSAREVWADLQPLMEEAVQSTLLNPMMLNSTSTASLQLAHHDIAPAARDSSDRANTTIKTKLYMASTNQEGVPASQPPRADDISPQLKPPRRFGLGPGGAIAASLLVALGIGAHLFKITPPLRTTQVIDFRGGSSPSQTLPASNGQPHRIEFAPNEISAMRQGNLQDKNAQPYIIEASQGQIMSVMLEGSGVVMDVLRSNQQGIDNSAYQTRNWTGPLPADDQYTIRVTGSGTYALDVAVTPLSRVESSETQRVKFSRGKAETTVTGNIQPNQIRRYLLKAKGNQ
ncbi:MAG: serine/threonine protein kinase [Leptolyngbyaceae cyanobacterium CSU_1_3]|nr:serine/threonine protein kinase [Leptolyngbyaceae cyanobacterium CSU_1_3]